MARDQGLTVPLELLDPALLEAGVPWAFQSCEQSFVRFSISGKSPALVLA